MRNCKVSPDAYHHLLAKATSSLHEGDYLKAQEYITKAMTLNMDAAAPHNLLGILMEIRGNENAARRHYRAAYSLEPEYKPACRNLERLALFQWGNPLHAYDFGDQPEVDISTKEFMKSILE